KTVNLPEEATVEDIEDLHMQAWKLGLKAIAIYRDNCKVGQPLSTGASKKAEEPTPAAQATDEPVPVRRRLPKRRKSTTTSFSVGGAEGYLTASAYETGELGEIFLRFGKQGSTLGGVMDAFSIAVSIGLQYGVPLETFVEKFTNLRFEPAGMTDDPDQRMATSIMDYVFRRLAMDYLDTDTRSAMGIHTNEERQRELETGSQAPTQHPVETPDDGGISEDAVAYNGGSLREETPQDPVHSSAELMEKFQGRVADAPLCMTCGARMRPSGSCHVCEGCGTTSGCS
ncbi:MAG TPA: vitamin B12-dependent ribonucleotide reductase, partial [Beutenbergiaceae bacterium]|nr:vitamin B12-dependent ribonucleotide reductase [Beutenbergiaceae bacterium]